MDFFAPGQRWLLFQKWVVILVGISCDKNNNYALVTDKGGKVSF